MRGKNPQNIIRECFVFFLHIRNLRNDDYES